MSNEALRQREQATMPIPHKMVGIVPLDAPTLQEAFVDDLGKEHDVVAWLDIPGDSYRVSDEEMEASGFGRLLINRTSLPERPATRVAVCREGTGKGKRDRFTVMEVREGKVQYTTSFDAQPTSSAKASHNTDPQQGDAFRSTDGFTYSVGIAKRPGGDLKGPALVFGFSGNSHASLVKGYNTSPTVSVAPDATLQTRDGSIYDVLDKANRGQRIAESIKGNAKLLLGVFAVYTALASGGLLDRAGEAFNNAHNDTVTRLDDANDRSYWMRLPDSVRNENDEQYHQAVTRVATTMGDLDTHNSQNIDQRAAEFKKRNADQLMPAETVQSYRERLNQAKTPDEAMSVLNEFMGFYGKGAQFLMQDEDSDGKGASKFDPNSSTEDVVWLAQQFINTFSYLPKGLVQLGQFDSVRFTGAPSSWSTEGFYSSDGKGSGTINFPVLSRASRVFDAGVNLLPDSMVDPANVPHNILHEFAHSFDWAGTSLTFRGESDDEGEVTYILRDIVQLPDQQSGYAASADPSVRMVERRAENFAAALDVIDSNGLAHPDQWRAFISTANTNRLRVLVELEAMYPGFTDYLASLRLNKYDAFRTPVAPFVQIG